MDEKLIDTSIQTIQKIKDNGLFLNYIDYIVFPFYKNLLPGTKINFDYPLTVLVGKNGGGKSSTLHALFGAPKDHTCSDFWFSTEVDPIAEDGDRPRYFYGYKENRDSPIKEVIKQRSKREGTEYKKEDLDYWETSRPRVTDGMKEKKRQRPVDKNVIYLDFRSEIGAFDKIMHFSRGSIDEHKELIRNKSIFLKRLFAGEPVRHRGRKIKMEMEILDDRYVKIISGILDKDYCEIRVADHALYRTYGTSVLLKTQKNGQYSEANAGSGETAVVQLVRKIEAAPNYSLVLLDEPEVSLHPGAQEKIRQYLLDVIIRKKLQVVVSTHSQNIIYKLPDAAIKLYVTDSNGKFKVLENVNYQETFYTINDRVENKKIIYCEDILAKTLLEKTMASMNKQQYFEVVYQPGGESSLVINHLPAIALNDKLSKNIFFVLDGDKDPEYHFDEDDLPKDEQGKLIALKKCVKKAYSAELPAVTDGTDGNGRIDQKIDAYLKYLHYFNTNVFFFPNKKIPEEIILESEYVRNTYDEVLKNHEYKINSKNAKDITCEISLQDHGNKDSYGYDLDRLTYRWSTERSDNKLKIEETISRIFDS